MTATSAEKHVVYGRAKKTQAPGHGFGFHGCYTLESPGYREAEAEYDGVIAVINERWRVIRATCGLQRIIQRRGGARWSSMMYCATKEGLLPGMKRCGKSDAKVMRAIQGAS